ncbi:MAG TPA: Uma2 family endonuclease [Vicinamibacteria bacterium]|nr:Uma2 family endonuclease [Vicinamibacteria bacterium]
MASRTPSTDAASIVALEPRRRLRIDEYHRMIAAGVFDEGERLELIEGVIVEMSPQSPRHAEVISRLCDPRFVSAGPDCLVRSRLPLTLAPDSEPEPDVAVVPRTAKGYGDGHPTTALLVFEVAGDSLRKDRPAKAQVYARAGIPEYVIVNLAQGTLEVHRDPDPEAQRYRTVTTLGRTDRFESSAVHDDAFSVAALLD